MPTGVNSKKILFLISGKSAVTMPGGLGAYAYNLARIFTDLDFRVFVIGFSDNEDEIEREGIIFRDIVTPFNALKGLGVALIAPYMVSNIREIISREKPGEVIVFGMATWNYVGIKLKKQMPGLKIKTIVSCFTTHKHELMGHIHGAPISDYGILPFLKYLFAYMLDLALIQRFDRIAIMDADRIIMHYESSRRIIEGEYGRIPTDKLFITPYCIEIYARNSGKRGEYKKRKGSDQKPRVVVICRQDPRKGINTFIKAVRILKKDGVDFDCFVVGSGPFKQDNMNLARKMGLADEINFVGYVDDIQPFLLGSDVYVLPSVEEGAGAISLLEAMKLGVPIVTTKCDGIPEDFSHERNALLVGIGDEKNMAVQIRRILEDERLKKSLSDQAKSDYKEKFTIDKMRKSMQKIVSDM